jgi:peptide/nickel transport system permease protein
VLFSSIPIGPTWFGAGGRFVLGADSNGRDIAVRLLYGGRNSLIVGIGSTSICIFFAIVLALLAGYFGGWIDFVITRFFDLFYAFPVVLLGIALGSALAINGFHHFGITIVSGSLWIPTLVISYVLIPYVGRPLRGQVLSLREKEFVEAAIAQGASPLRIMFSELLPNITSSVLVFFTLIIANNIVLEAALSFLGAGVQDPTPSWGKLIADGQTLIVTRPVLALAPGIAIVLTVLALNVFGDGLRDALDPRAKVRVEH